jgi:flagellar biosynthesis protein FlgN
VTAADIPAHVDAALCREHLGRLLNEEVALLGELESRLGHEYGLLVADDIDGLDAAGQARQSCVTRLLKLEDERVSLCRMLGQAPDMKGVERLMAWCDPTGSLATLVGECAERSGRCRQQNLQNGMLVSARLQRVSQLLGLVGDAPQSRTYARGGYGTAPVLNPGRMVTASA